VRADKDEAGSWASVKRVIRSHLPLRGLALASTASGLPSHIRLDALSVAFRPYAHEDAAAAPNARPTLHLYIVGGEVGIPALAACAGRSGTRCC
jgi:hypothetical protein